MHAKTSLTVRSLIVLTAGGVFLLLWLASSSSVEPGVRVDTDRYPVASQSQNFVSLEPIDSSKNNTSFEVDDDTVCRDFRDLEAEAFGLAGGAEAWYAERARVVNVLSQSSTPEHLHAAALVSDDPDDRIALMTKALSINPWDPVLLWGAVQMCGEPKVTTQCPLEAWGQRLIAVDSENSEAWIRVAVNRYAADDVPGALAALQRASSASQSNGYWADYIEVMMRGYAASRSEPFASRAISAVNIAAQHLPRAEPVLNMCREQSAESPKWGETCLTYGSLVERQGKTDYAVGIAVAVQRVTHEALGNTAKAEELKTRRETERASAVQLNEDYDPAEDQLVLFTPKLFWSYLADLRSEGERAALKKSRLIAREMIKSRPELRCAGS